MCKKRFELKPAMQMQISNVTGPSGVITQVISKSDEREARGRFEITSAITP